MNVFAFTDPGLYPGYVSINTDESGQPSITVRESGKDGLVGHTVNLAVSTETLVAMADAILKSVAPTVSGGQHG